MSSILSDCLQICGITENIQTLIPNCNNTTSYDDFIGDDLRCLSDMLSINNDISNNDIPNDLQNCTPTLTTTNCIPSDSEALSSPSSDIYNVREEGQTNNTPVEISKEEKPIESYIQIIATTILQSVEQKLLLSQIYENINNTWSKFSMEESTWKNSVRHTLSTNLCFRKNGRAPSGRGYYWSIHPACLSMFTKGDFRRREAKRRVQLMQQKMNKQQEHNTTTSLPTSRYVQHIPEVMYSTYLQQPYTPSNQHQPYWMKPDYLYNSSLYSAYNSPNYQTTCNTMSAAIEQPNGHSTSPSYIKSHPVQMTSSTTGYHPYTNKRTSRYNNYTSTNNASSDIEHVYNSNTYAQHQQLLQQYYCR